MLVSQMNNWVCSCKDDFYGNDCEKSKLIFSFLSILIFTCYFTFSSLIRRESRCTSKSFHYACLQSIYVLYWDCIKGSVKHQQLLCFSEANF